MYNSYETATAIKMLAAHKQITIKQMLEELHLGKNFLVNMAKGKMPVSDNLAKIADYLDCSVDYLLGRTDVPEVNKKKAYVHHMGESHSTPYIAAYGEGDVIPKGKFTEEDIEELKKRGRNH